MIVEFCGIPGCGKTTITESLNNHYQCIKRDKFLICKSFKSKIYRKLVYFSYFKFPFLKSTRIIKKFVNRYPNSDDKYVKRLLDMFIAYKRAKNRLYILDEGALQYITSICYAEPLVVNNVLYNLIKLFYKKKKSCVIFVDVDIGTSINRIKKRSRDTDRYNLNSYEEIFRLLKQKRENIEIILDTAKKINAIEYVKYENDNQLIRYIKEQNGSET